MTGAYWMIGRHIVEFEQSGEKRAAYGANLIEKLATDMTWHFVRGFSRQNLWQMRPFGLAYPHERIFQTLSRESAQPLGRIIESLVPLLPRQRKTKRPLGTRWRWPPQQDEWLMITTNLLDENLPGFCRNAHKTAHGREKSWSCRM